MDIQEKIGQIMGGYAAFVDDDSDYFVKPKEKQKWLNRILSLIRQEVSEAIPKIDVIAKTNEEICFKSGYKTACSDIRTELLRKGLI